MISALVGWIVLAPTAFVDVRVEGPGYLRFARDGRAVYAREARLTVSGGRLVGPGGLPTLPTLTVPATPERLDVAPTGEVKATFAGRETTVGRLTLAVFTESAALVEDKGFFVAADRPSLRTPGAEGVGTLQTKRPERPLPPPKEATPTKQPDPKPTAKNPATIVSADYLLSQPTTAPLGATQVRVRPLSEAIGATYTLADIAEIEGAGASKLRGIPIGDTPPYGIERPIDEVRIQARLRNAGIDPTKLRISVPSGAKVVRKGQRAPHAAFVQKAIEAAKAQLGAAGDFTQGADGPEMMLPLGSLNLVSETVSARGQRVSVIVAAYVDGVRVKSRTVELLRSNLPPTLKVGQQVKVRVRSQDVVLETEGKVTQAGKPGESVTVQTVTGATLTGSVAPDGIVEVKV